MKPGKVELFKWSTIGAYCLLLIVVAILGDAATQTLHRKLGTESSKGLPGGTAFVVQTQWVQVCILAVVLGVAILCKKYKCSQPTMMGVNVMTFLLLAVLIAEWLLAWFLTTPFCDAFAVEVMGQD